MNAPPLSLRVLLVSTNTLLFFPGWAGSQVAAENPWTVYDLVHTLIIFCNSGTHKSDLRRCRHHFLLGFHVFVIRKVFFSIFLGFFCENSIFLPGRRNRLPIVPIWQAATLGGGAGASSQNGGRSGHPACPPFSHPCIFKPELVIAFWTERVRSWALARSRGVFIFSYFPIFFSVRKYFLQRILRTRFVS